MIYVIGSKNYYKLKNIFLQLELAREKHLLELDHYCSRKEQFKANVNFTVNPNAIPHEELVIAQWACSRTSPLIFY